MSTAQPAPVDTLETFDWDTFLDRYWDRRPVLIRGHGFDPAPFDGHEVFEGAVAAATRAPAGRVTFTVGSRRLTDPGDLLPQPEDASFSAYQRRVTEQLAGAPFALVVRELHARHHPLWLRERDFVAALWDRAGQPLLGATTTLHYGTCGSDRPAHTRGATFLYTLLGRPRLRLDPGGPAERAAEVPPGDLLYWPPGHRYAAEPGTTPGAVVHLGVPRHPPRPGDALCRLLAPGPNPVSPQGGWGGDDILVPDEANTTALPAELPRVLAEGLAQYRAAGRPAPMERWLARESLRHATDGGLRPVPPPARPGYFTDDDGIRAVERVLWSEAAGRRLVAACGHVMETDLTAPELASVVGLLNAGTTVTVGELVPSARTLVSRLAGFRAVERL
ncbi:hypothetical protein V2W30_35405 [Streptomyces sp. Q6]|uniref:Uncharacterized protein n=1 Tax=Streptomyces citrinus TaxID=3118173 RepID=A0ACD5AQL2_9ACTN